MSHKDTRIYYYDGVNENNDDDKIITGLNRPGQILSSVGLFARRLKVRTKHLRKKQRNLNYFRSKANKN